MIGIQNLTEEQEAFASQVGGAFVHACPGAGKTRTIIGRLAKIAATLPPRRGVAVLSFTNSAVDEFRERCQAAGLAPLLKHPSFMGTLDAFVRHFVVLPGCEAANNRRPIILDSWDTLGIGIRLSGRFAFPGDAVSLDLFDPETNAIDPAKIGHTGLRNHVFQHEAKYQRAAAQRRRDLLQAGYLSTGDARAQTLRIIRTPLNGEALGRALAARFHEVMVDEGQDCNPLDLQVLSWLREYGVHVTFVCDPDQAIYEFRNGNPEGIQRFKETYSVEAHRQLTGNFRSSPAVCRLAATLRSADQVDQSVGHAANVPHPVIVLTYPNRVPNANIGQAFLKRIVELDLDPTDAILLAHSGKDAQRAAGTLLSNSNGSSRIELLARRAAEFSSPSATARSRERVVLAVETLLLDLMGLRDQNEHLLRTVERVGLDRRAHRRHALKFLTSIPTSCGDADNDRLAWIDCVRREAEQLNLPLPVGLTVRKFFVRPKKSSWSDHLQMHADLGLRCANIHEVKGREYGAVCIVIPPDRKPENRSEALLGSWEARSDAEAKRVLYVGSTRARYLAALAVPIAFADRCIAVLTAGQVPHTRSDL